MINANLITIWRHSSSTMKDHELIIVYYDIKRLDQAIVFSWYFEFDGSVRGWWFIAPSFISESISIVFGFNC